MHSLYTIPLLASSLMFGSLVSCSSTSPDIPLASSTVQSTQSNVVQSMLGKAQALEKAGKTRKAAAQYHDIFKKQPHSPAAAEARFAQGRLLDQQGDVFTAFEAYQDVISRYPDSRHYATAFARQEVIAHAAASGALKNNFLGMKTRISPAKVERMLSSVRDNAPRATSAPKAQFAIGQVWQKDGNAEKATAAYQKIALDYPNSAPAPEALYQTGEILVLKAQRGNQNTAHVDRARGIYRDLVQRYPRHRRATDARKRLATLSGQDVQRSFETAEFYRQKDNPKSAIFYYREVLRKTKAGQYAESARKRIAELTPSL